MDRGRQCALRNAARARRRSRHRAARPRAGSAGARSNAARRRRSARRPRSAAVAEMGHHAAGALLECIQASAAVIAVRRERIAQQPVDPLPGSQHLRTCPVRDHAARGIEDLPRRDRRRRDRAVSRPSAREPGDQFGLRHDPGAAAGKLARRRARICRRPSRAARSIIPASRPLIEPPTIRARRWARRCGIKCPAISHHANVLYCIVTIITGGTPWP